MNVRGWGVGKLEDISAEYERSRMDVIGVMET